MRRAFLFAPVLLMMCPALTRAGSCPTITIMSALSEGDAVAGVGNVTRIDNLAVNNLGHWLVEADTDFATTTQDQVLVKTGVLFLREDDALDPAPAQLSSFDSVNLNNDGNSGMNFFLRNTGATTNDSGIYFNSSLVIQESAISTAPQFSAGTPYIGFFDSKINTNSNNQIMLVASVDDPAIATTVDRAIVRLDLDGSGNLVSETAPWKEGDILPGQIETVADFGTGPHESAMNDAGDILYVADMNGDTAKDIALYLNGTLLAQEGGTSPLGGRNYELLSGRGNDLGNGGDYVFKANLNGSTADDDVIIRNGALFMQEGQSLPDIAPFTLTTFGVASGPVQIDDNGNVLWYGTWNDPNLEQNYGLFLNDCLIVQGGVTSIGGFLIDTMQSGQDAFAMSDNGRWIIFEALLANGLEGAFLLEVAEPIAVELASFEARAVDGAIEVSWSTAREEDHLGFRLHRSTRPDLGYELVSDELFRPGNYEYRDRTAEAGVRYWYRVEAVDRLGRGEFFGPVSAEIPVAAAWRLGQSRPNPLPSGASASIDFDLARASTATLRVFDLSGKLVRTILDETLAPGTHAATWDGADDGGAAVSAGLYFYVLETPEITLRKKLLVSR